MAAKAMTPFVPSYATNHLLPPWNSPGSTCWCFAIPMDPSRIETYLTNYLNAEVPGPPPPRYSVLDGLDQQYGLLVVCHQPQISSEATPNRLAHHTETYLAIPVYRTDLDEQGQPKSEKSITWVQPFAFGNNSYVMFGSREVWGMDMTHATTGGVRSTFPALRIDWTVMGMQTFSPQSKASLIPCLRVAAEVGLGPPNEGDPNFAAFCGKLGAKGYPVPFVPIEARSPRESVEVELNNLKQFRDVYNMNAAIYRAIVQSISTHRNIEFDPHTLKKAEVSFFWSDSIKEMLWLLFGKTGADGSPSNEHTGWLSVPIKVDVAYAFTSNVRFEVKRTLHACRSPDQAPRPNLGAVLRS